MTTSHVLSLTCDDRPGIVHAVTAAVLDVGGNIVENAQFTDPDTNTFCMRMVVATDGRDVEAVRAAVDARLHDSDARLQIRPEDHRPRVLILVSKFDHCLVDLLDRWRNGGLDVELPVIVSNHPDCTEVADRYRIPFLHLPVTLDTKAARVTHAHTASQLVALGQDTERLVLSRAVRAWAEDRIHLIGNKTIVFT